MEYICKHTIIPNKDAQNEMWIMAGDFNSRTRKDNHFYKYNENSTAFLVHDYILENTPYVDIIGERFAGEFHTTTQGKSRIDFVYCTQPLYERILDAYVVCDEYTSINATRDEKTKFYFPSDHLPILVDFEMK